MPSNDNIVREYIQGDIKNGQMFDAKYVDRMETGIEAGFHYSNYLEEHFGNEINNTKKELTQYTDDAKAAAIAHTDSEIAKTRTDLTAYTDAAKAEAKTHTNNSINNLRTELQKYTDTAESDANKYTDTKVSALSKTTTTNISNALNTAKEYTDTEVAELKTYSEQYATGIKNDLLNGAGGAYDTLKELGDLIDDNTDAIDALDKVAASKAPINHASTATTYGIGTSSNYGHVKLSDSTSSSSAASAGIAASPKAVKSAYDLATTANNAAATAGNNSITGLSVSGTTITYTKGNGTSGTISTQDTTYTLPAAGTSLGGVKSGGDVSISNGTITVNNNSHTHTIANVTNLQSELNTLQQAIDNKTFSLTTATSTALGGVKIGYAENGKNYPVELNGSGQMYVNVPWTDTVISNYLPLSGGTLTGSLTIPSNNKLTVYQVDFGNAYLYTDSNASFMGRTGFSTAGYHYFNFNGSNGNLYLDGNIVLNAANYTSYTVTKTGSGASGTWGINISGSAGGVAWGNVSGKPSFATVATSGSYNDLTNKPTIPTTMAWSSITGKPSFATVATSGSYNDLTNKPSIPAAYTLPNATASTLGGVKVGANITVSSGTISLSKENVIAALGYTPQAQLTNANTTSF